jgi:hypothetical protein
MGEGSPEMNAGFGDDPKLEKMPRLISTRLPWSTVPSGN